MSMYKEIMALLLHNDMNMKLTTRDIRFDTDCIYKV